MPPARRFLLLERCRGDGAQARLGRGRAQDGHKQQASSTARTDRCLPEPHERRQVHGFWSEDELARHKQAVSKRDPKGPRSRSPVGTKERGQCQHQALKEIAARRRLEPGRKQVHEVWSKGEVDQAVLVHWRDWAAMTSEQCYKRARRKVAAGRVQEALVKSSAAPALQLLSALSSLACGVQSKVSSEPARERGEAGPVGPARPQWLSEVKPVHRSRANAC